MTGIRLRTKLHPAPFNYSPRGTTVRYYFAGLVANLCSSFPVYHLFQECCRLGLVAHFFQLPKILVSSRPILRPMLSYGAQCFPGLVFPQFFPLVLCGLFGNVGTETSPQFGQMGDSSSLNLLRYPRKQTCPC